MVTSEVRKINVEGVDHQEVKRVKKHKMEGVSRSRDSQRSGCDYTIIRTIIETNNGKDSHWRRIIPRVVYRYQIFTTPTLRWDLVPIVLRPKSPLPDLSIQRKDVEISRWKHIQPLDTTKLSNVNYLIRWNS